MARKTLRIVHCFRSPVGGIFRHVRDLVEAQAAEGHEVAIVCDSITGGAFEEGLIAAAAPLLSLGVHRIAMRRAIAPSDLRDMWTTFRLFRDLQPDVIHGHGAKGGAYSRIIGSALRLTGMRAARLYTPHGGSLHYDAKSAGGRLYFALERWMERATDHLLFVSAFEEAAYRAKVGAPRTPARIVHNGLGAAEFEPVVSDREAADFLYIGMLRPLKGPDLFVEALVSLARRGGAPTAVIVGAGDQRPALEQRVQTAIPDLVRFHDPMPARQAFALGRTLVVPSRAESLPYVVMEALAAGRPVIATDVGGIGEIIPPHLQSLVRPNDSEGLADAMAAALPHHPAPSTALRDHVVRHFSASAMAADVTSAYQRSLARTSAPRLAPVPAPGKPSV